LKNTTPELRAFARAVRRAAPNPSA
jgi:hypothetical protein